MYDLTVMYVLTNCIILVALMLLLHCIELKELKVINSNEDRLRKYCTIDSKLFVLQKQMIVLEICEDVFVFKDLLSITHRSAI